MLRPKRKRMSNENSDLLCDEKSSLHGSEVRLFPFRLCVTHIFCYFECFCVSRDNVRPVESPIDSESGYSNRIRNRYLDEIMVPRDWGVRFHFPVGIQDLYGYFFLDVTRNAFLLYKHFRLVASYDDDLQERCRGLFEIVRASSIFSITANFCVPAYLPSSYVEKCTSVDLLHIPVQHNIDDWKLTSCFPALRTLVLSIRESQWPKAIGLAIAYARNLPNLTEVSLRETRNSGPVVHYMDRARIVVLLRPSVSRAVLYTKTIHREVNGIVSDIEHRLYPWVGLTGELYPGVGQSMSSLRMRLAQGYELIFRALQPKHLSARYEDLATFLSLQPHKLQHMGIERVDMVATQLFTEYIPSVSSNGTWSSVDELIEYIQSLVRRSICVSLYFRVSRLYPADLFEIYADLCKRLRESGVEITDQDLNSCEDKRGYLITRIEV